MASLLALMAAAAFGTSDFLAGLSSRRLSAPTVTGIAQTLGLATAALAVLVHGGDGPRTDVLLWGAASGFGNVAGTLALYQGLAVGRMSVVATLSGLLAAVIPAVVGLALGDALGPLTALGILIAIPAIALVSWQPENPGAGGSGARWGVLAGLGFALLFIALAQAGSDSGAWPLLAGETVCVAIVAPLAARSILTAGRSTPRPVLVAVAAGVLAALANLLFLAATGQGELAIVAVLTSLYPGFTVILARLFLAEHWNPRQVIGLFAALLAVVLVSVGAA
ncbi:MAG TPA: DMT family transporter [Solirubrobacterales bacterium]|nr:DMT family transporter [Solirubrobacterales bacterium]